MNKHPAARSAGSGRLGQAVGHHSGCAVLGIDIEVVKRNDTLPGFVPVKHRWVVEQTHGTLMLHRRLTRDPDAAGGMFDDREDVEAATVQSRGFGEVGGDDGVGLGVQERLQPRADLL